jgi:hypothetical protein
MNVRRATALAVTVAIATLFGCSYDVESPPASNKSVAPDLVCVEQLTKTVVLTGDGFTPMPQKTLEQPEKLVLPRIDLQIKFNLDASSASGKPYTIPDDPLHPADPVRSHVHWSDETKMSFTVTPELKIPPGVYDVVVTNPDDKHKAIFPSSFAAVPPPTLTATSPDILCDDEADQTVVLTGTTILQVGKAMPTVHMSGMSDGLFPVTKVDGCTPIPGKYTEGVIQDCTSATFTIPKGALKPGPYKVTLTNPQTAECVSTDPITIQVVPPPTVVGIAPDLICDAQGDQTMTVTGTGFLQFSMPPTMPVVAVGTQMFKPTAVTGCMPVDGMFMEGMVQTCTSMTFTIPLGTFTEGDYAVVVTNPPPADCKSLETVNLHVAPPPSITGANPLAVCDAQGDQTVTIDGTGFLEVGAALPSVTIGTQTLTAASATGCVMVPGTFIEGVVQECTGLVVTVPKGTFTKGVYPIVVKNPDPAGCSSTEVINLTIDDPPVVTGTVPKTLCQGGGNLTVNGQNFLPAATVSLQSMGQPTIMSASSIVNAAGTQIDATFGGPLTAGDVYDVVVDNADGCTDAPPHQKVTVVTGPIAFFADPEIAYNGINTRITIYVTTLTLPATVTITPAGMTAPVTTLTVTGTVPGHPNRLQAIVPQGQAAGVYDLHLVDATLCPTVLPNAITVTSTLSVALKSVIPPFGWTQQETPVTILRTNPPPAGMTAPFVATPRVFLNPAPTQPAGNGCPALPAAIQVQSVSFVDLNTLTAVVARNQPTCLYDLIVVNPDKTVGYLPSAFTVQSAQPPSIAAVTPSSIVAATGQAVVVSGQSFSGSKITATCVDANGNPIAAPNVVSGAVACGAGGCTQPATIDGSALPVGAVCVIRITNSDGSFFDYSAVGVTNSSLNLPGTHAGTNLNVGRRALIAAAGNATAAARFVYAIGGDGGAAMATMPFTSTEVASVDLFGKMSAWSLQPTSTLGTARSFAASATVGRYIYVAGGSDGTNALASAERAMILSPLEVPGLDIDDLVPLPTGLDPGYWLYRVSATFTAADPENPSGESLASDEFIVKVPTFAGKKIQVILAWTAPADSLGAPIPNVAGYNIYRTPMVDGVSGGEVLLATVGTATLKYTDDGTATPGTQKPLTLGTTGKWAALPAMTSTRKGAAGAAGFDPVSANQLYFYALLGLNQANTALTSYEYLTVTVQPNGHHTAGAWKTGTSNVGQGRWQHGAFVGDHTVSSTIPAGSTYVYIGGGLDAASAAANAVDAGLIGAGGDLGAINATPKDFGSNSAGYGVCAANGELFAFGGANASPSAGAKSAGLVAPPPTLAGSSWNSEGISLIDSRYLMGSAVQSAFIFLVAGQTGASAASKTTETVIW